MAGLQDLSNELLVDIADYLKKNSAKYDYSGCPSDLLLLSLASKTLREAATPALYGWFHSGRACHGVRRFLRTLCLVPERAENVRVLHLQLYYEQPLTAPTSFDFAHFASALKKGVQPGPLRDTALEALRTGCHTAELLAVLCLTTNITELTLEDTTWRLAFYSGLGVEQSYSAHCASCPVCPDFEDCLSHILSAGLHNRLTTVTICTNPKTRTGLSQQRALFAVLRLPSLRSFNYSRDDLLIDAWNMFNAFGGLGPGPAFPILSLISCDLAATTACHMLSNCIKLRTLKIHLAEDARFDLDACCKTLRNHQSSLETFVIVRKRRRNVVQDVFQEQSALGSLLNLACLTELQIDGELLVGMAGWSQTRLKDVLPRSISEFAIFANDEVADIGAILMAFTGWKPTGRVSLRIRFPVQQGLDDALTGWKDMQEMHENLHSLTSAFQSARFAVFGGCYSNMFVDFRCYFEDCDELAAFGWSLQTKGLESFLDAARNYEDVKLWDGGPKRAARGMFEGSFPDP